MIMTTNFNISMMMMILPKKSVAAMINNDHDHQLQHCHDDDDPADEERGNDERDGCRRWQRRSRLSNEDHNKTHYQE